MLHAAETWNMKADIINCLLRNDRAMIHWICNVQAKDEVSSEQRMKLAKNHFSQSLASRT